MSIGGITTKVEVLALEVAQALGVELIGVEYVKEGGASFLRIFIDCTSGITVDKCEKFTKALSPKLDEADPIPHSYILEISSPGLERRLRKEDEYARFEGRKVKIKTYAPVNGTRVIKGSLAGVQNGKVLVEIASGIVAISLENVATARLVADIPVAGRKKHLE